VRENHAKQKLKVGKPVLGCFVRYADADIAEFLSLQGFDLLVYDGEHGVLEPRDCQQMVRAAELHSVTPIVRPATNDQSLILRYMDTGAQGVLMPMVESPRQAEEVVRSAKYPPIGKRGVAAVRAADYGQREPIDQYTQIANDNTLVCVQIESTAGIDALPEIVSIDGIDVVFIGPSDLSSSLGVLGQLDHPKMQQAMDKISRIVNNSPKKLGLMVPNADAAKQWIQRGASFITVTCEMMLKAGCHNYLAPIHKATTQ